MNDNNKQFLHTHLNFYKFTIFFLIKLIGSDKIFFSTSALTWPVDSVNFVSSKYYHAREPMQNTFAGAVANNKQHMIIVRTSEVVEH